jgi:hypothetical protein
MKTTKWSSAAARRLLTLADSPPTLEEAVRTIVCRLLDGVPCPPTDLAAVGARVGVTGFYPVQMPICGELRLEGGSLKVAYAAELPAARRNFTIAHELGHAVFESTGPNCPRVGAELERLCDMLATELLMPRVIFLDAAGAELTLRKVYELARIFGTSLRATALRCHELCRASLCEADMRSTLWGCGMMRKGARAGADGEVRDAIRRALAGESGAAEVFVRTDVWSGQCLLEWAPNARRSRAFLMAQPLRGRAACRGASI